MRSTKRLAKYQAPTLIAGVGNVSTPAARPVGWLLLALCLMLVAVISIFPTRANDLWWQLKTGELIWQRGVVPMRDVFSHTATGQPWFVQEWLAELLLFSLYRFVAPEALVLYRCLLPAVAFAFVFWRCRVRGASPALAASLTAIAAYSARPFFDIRPQLLSFVLFALSLLVLEQWRGGVWRRGIWALPAITLLWANLHGAFMLVFALLAVEIASELWEGANGRWNPGRMRALAATAVLCVVAGLVNPRGADAYRYAFLLLGHSQMLNDIQEWWSPDFHDTWSKPLSYLLVLTAAAMALGRRGEARDLLLLAGLIHSTLFSGRHAPLAAIAAAPVLAYQFAGCAPGARRWMLARGVAHAHWRVAALCSITLTLALGVILHARALPGASWFEYCTLRASYPERACDFLLNQPGGGRLYNRYNWGGYCIWRLWPRYGVFIDGRAEVYFDAGYADHETIESAQPGWDVLLRRYQVDTILIPPDGILAHSLSKRREWQRVYEDDQAVIFRHVSAHANTATESKTRGYVEEYR
jgi:hypothetical protein